MSNEDVLSVSGLSKHFGDLVAVDKVSFEVQKGEIFGFLGPNGAGKTTTLSMLTTITEPSSGDAEMFGHSLLREAHKIKPRIGLVPQELSLYPTLSARDNLSFFGKMYGLSGGDLAQRIDSVLEITGLADRAKDSVKEYSGGMKRRLNIGAGLMHSPDLLFLDEPTVGVDPQSRNFIFDHVEKMKEEGMTVIYTTHYMEEAERLCDRVGIIDQGQIVAVGSVKELIASLGGGVVRIGFADDVIASNLVQSVGELPPISEATQEGPLISAKAKQTNDALAAIIEVCAAKSAHIQSLEVLEPNLESLFLSLTGRRLRD